MENNSYLIYEANKKDNYKLLILAKLIIYKYIDGSIVYPRFYTMWSIKVPFKIKNSIINQYKIDHHKTGILTNEFIEVNNDVEKLFLNVYEMIDNINVKFINKDSSDIILEINKNIRKLINHYEKSLL